MPQLDAADPNSVVSHDLVSLHDFTKEFRPEEYWTAERMEGAEPFELASENLPTDLEPLPQDVPSAENPGKSGDDRTVLAEALAARFRTERVEAHSEIPYSAVGKLFATFGGADKSATAFVVGRNCILTAGHCVYPGSPGQWVANVSFAPAYRNGAPHGLWPAKSLHTLAGWTAQRSDARVYDVGGIVLQHPVSETSGRIKLLTNQPTADDPFQSVGYPKHWLSHRYDFDGKAMWRCIGERQSQGRIMTMANNMTEGASGGPWLIEQEKELYANGLNSFRRSDQPSSLSSPYFGQGIVNMMRHFEA